MSVKIDLYNAIKDKLLSLKVDEISIFKETESSSLAIYKESENEGFTILKETETAKGLIATFGHWNDQFSQIENEIAFRFPAVFLEFTDLDWKTNVNTSLVNQSQQRSGQCEFVLHIGIKNLAKEADSFEQDVLIIDEIVSRINTLQGENFTPISVINEKDDNNKGNIRAWNVTFRTNVKETGIYLEKTGHLVELKLTGTY